MKESHPLSVLKRRHAHVRRHAFTLIELLVVIAIIGILSSMLLPSLGAAKQRAKVILCVNNLRQIGMGIQMYVDEHQGHFPPSSVPQVDPLTGTNLTTDPTAGMKSTLNALGGRDAVNQLCFPNARSRPLWQYIKPSDIFRCPDDRGQGILPCLPPCAPKIIPSDYKVMGISYHYNGTAPTVLVGGGFLLWDNRPVPGEMLAGRAEGWIPEPSRFIVMHEPPARLYGCFETGPRWYRWHFTGAGPSQFVDPRKAGGRFISPILFADGHAQQHNFTHALTRDPLHPYEETTEWMWYKGPDRPLKKDEK